MRVIPSTEVRMTPMHCAVAPTIGQMSGHRFIDTGYDMFASSVNTPNRIYISEPAVGEMAKQLGWTTPEEVHELVEQVHELATELAESRTEANELQAQLAAVQVLKNAGFAQTRPPGRPKKVTA